MAMTAITRIMAIATAVVLLFPSGFSEISISFLPFLGSICASLRKLRSRRLADRSRRKTAIMRVTAVMEVTIRVVSIGKYSI